MLRLTKKLLFAIEAVLDIAYNASNAPVQSGDITGRQGIPRRYLEQVLQQLVRAGILEGVRGPRGGYRLARERRRITADDILRAAGTIEEGEEAANAGSALLEQVVMPAVGQAEKAFSSALARINLDELVRRAEPLRDLSA